MLMIIICEGYFTITKRNDSITKKRFDFQTIFAGLILSPYFLFIRLFFIHHLAVYTPQVLEILDRLDLEFHGGGLIAQH